MSIVELISKYDALGVRLWLDEGRLRFRSPAGILNEQRMDELRDHKKDLIKYLKTPEEASVEHDPVHHFEPFPLTPIQGAYLVGRGGGYELGDIGCHGYVELALPSLEKARLEAAWHSLIVRHDMLRTVILENGYQKTLPEVSLPSVNELDLRGADQRQIEVSIKKIRDELSNKQYKPDEWPLFDLTLTTMDDGCILHFSIDMLIVDFVSIDILLDELDHLYYHPENLLPDLDVTFRDIVLFDRALQERPSMLSKKEIDRQYWYSRIENMPGAPELPMNSDLGKRQQINFKRHAFKLDAQKWAFFRRYAGNNNITPSCAVLSAFSDAISRWSKQSRFCLNITMLLRPEIHPQINKIVGDFTSSSVLAVNQDRGTTFLQRTHALQEQLWLDMEHRTFSGIELLREMNRQSGKRVLLPIVFTSMLGLGTRKRAQGEYMSEARLNYGISQTPQVLIDCQVSEQHGELHLNWDVRDGIFPKGMIEDAFSSFGHLLGEMGLKNETWELDRPLKLPAHIGAIRTMVNDTGDEFPVSLLQDGFYHSMQNCPDAPALISGHKQFTYKELGIYSAAVQQALLKGNCTDGDIVAVALGKGVWQVASVLGVLFTGGAYLPMDTDEPRARMDSILNDSGARIVITSGKLAKQNWPAHVHVINSDKLVLDQNGLPEPKNADPEALAYIIYTSGSTGKPKGVMMNHRAAQNTIQDINKRFNVDAGDRILCLANLNFDLSVYDIFGLLTAGGTLVMPDAGKRKDPSHWFDLIQRHDITMWNSVPAQLHMLLTYLDSKDGMAEGNASLRVVMLSGDWISPKLPGRLSRHYPAVRIVSLGGATEAGIWSIFYEICKVPEDATSIPYGKPLSNQQIHVLNDHMQPCPDWTTGEIYIGGDSLALGYLNDPQRSREQFLIHPRTKELLYKTGDLGRYRSDGVVEFLGREDNQIKIRGFRVELGEIEKVAQNHPDISMAAAIITGESSLDRQLALFAEAKIVTGSDENSSKILDLKKTCLQVGTVISSNIDRPLLARWIDLLDRAALVSMIETFQQSGLFTNKDDTHSINEIIATLNIKPEFNSLIRRWLSALCAGNILKLGYNNASYSLLATPLGEDSTSTCWEALESVEKKIHFSQELLRFLRLSCENLSGLLCGDVDPIELFFPKGQLETAFAAYSDNLVNCYLNQVISEGVLSIAKQHKINSNRPLKILEIGAGTGGTTTGLLPRIDEFEVEYLFTDISQFFLNEAQKRFKQYPWVRYGLYDLNHEYWMQNMKAASWDIIICANVIHNSENVPAALSTLKELAVPGGYICIIEGTLEPISWLTSLEFVFKRQGIRFSDDRAGNEMAFLSYDTWMSMFADIGADIICAYPDKNDLFTLAGQTAFLAQFPLKCMPVSSQVLKDYLKLRLPPHMMPTYIELLPSIPLSVNGKIDRASLKRRVDSEKKNSVKEAEPPKSGLEKRIADIWCSVLNRDAIGRDEDFFTAGGDSLLVAQVIARMRELLPEARYIKWDMLMREILKLPTVAAVAEKISSKDRESDAVTTLDGVPSKAGFSFAILAEGKADTQTMEIIIHTGNGNLASYRHLLPYLVNDNNKTIAGISLTDVEYLLAIPLHRVIEELGRQYAEAILQYKIHCIELIGYCSGGLLVMETARNLLESGVEPMRITIIDTATFPYQIEDELLMERLFAQQFGADLKRTGHFIDDNLLASAVVEFLDSQKTMIPNDFLRSLNGPFATIADCYRKLSKIPQSKRLSEIINAMPGNGKNGSGSEGFPSLQADVLTILYQIFRHTLQATTMYKPRPFAGDIRLLCAADQTLQAIPGVPSNTTRFWNEITLGNIDVVNIDGNHLSCMQPPYVAAIANLLRPGRR